MKKKRENSGCFIGAKKGLSPVIATVLLVLIGLVLAIIIFFWAKSFIGESLEKDGRAIDKSCENLRFTAEAISGQSGGIWIVNTGNVPIYGIEILKVGESEQSKVAESFPSTIGAGETSPVIDLPSGVNSGDDLLIVPILLGKIGTRTATHTCDEDYGERITVK